MRKLAVLITGTAVIALSAAPADAALIQYGTRATFNAATASQQTETFEDANFQAGGVACSAPANSSTTSACFDPGDILPGLQVTTEGAFTGDPQALIIIDNDAGNGFASGLVFANFFDDILSLQFAGGVTAVGFDAYHLFDPSPFTISVFGTSGLLGSFNLNVTDTGAGTFFGVTGTDLITRITLSSANGMAEGVDNVSFGTAAVPEPATLLLFGTTVLVAGVRRWRHKRS